MLEERSCHGLAPEPIGPQFEDYGSRLRLSLFGVIELKPIPIRTMMTGSSEWVVQGQAERLSSLTLSMFQFDGRTRRGKNKPSPGPGGLIARKGKQNFSFEYGFWCMEAPWGGPGKASRHHS